MADDESQKSQKECKKTFHKEKSSKPRSPTSSSQQYPIRVKKHKRFKMPKKSFKKSGNRISDTEEKTQFERVAVKIRPARSKIKKKSALKWKFQVEKENSDAQKICRGKTANKKSQNKSNIKNESSVSELCEANEGSSVTATDDSSVIEERSKNSNSRKLSRRKQNVRKESKFEESNSIKKEGKQVKQKRVKETMKKKPDEFKKREKDLYKSLSSSSISSDQQSNGSHSKTRQQEKKCLSKNQKQVKKSVGESADENEEQLYSKFYKLSCRNNSELSENETSEKNEQSQVPLGCNNKNGNRKVTEKLLENHGQIRRKIDKHNQEYKKKGRINQEQFTNEKTNMKPQLEKKPCKREKKIFQNEESSSSTKSLKSISSDRIPKPSKNKWPKTVAYKKKSNIEEITEEQMPLQSLNKSPLRNFKNIINFCSGKPERDISANRTDNNDYVTVKPHIENYTSEKSLASFGLDEVPFETHASLLPLKHDMINKFNRTNSFASCNIIGQERTANEVKNQESIRNVYDEKLRKDSERILVLSNELENESKGKTTKRSEHISDKKNCQNSNTRQSYVQKNVTSTKQKISPFPVERKAWLGESEKQLKEDHKNDMQNSKKYESKSPSARATVGTQNIQSNSEILSASDTVQSSEMSSTFATDTGTDETYQAVTAATENAPSRWKSSTVATDNIIYTHKTSPFNGGIIPSVHKQSKEATGENISNVPDIPMAITVENLSITNDTEDDLDSSTRDDFENNALSNAPSPLGNQTIIKMKKQSNADPRFNNDYQQSGEKDREFKIEDSTIGNSEEYCYKYIGNHQCECYNKHSVCRRCSQRAKKILPYQTAERIPQPSETIHLQPLDMIQPVVTPSHPTNSRPPEPVQQPISKCTQIDNPSDKTPQKPKQEPKRPSQKEASPDFLISDDDDAPLLSTPACKVLDHIIANNFFRNTVTETESQLLKKFFIKRIKFNDLIRHAIFRALDCAITRVKELPLSKDLKQFLSNRENACNLMFDAMQFGRNQRYLPPYWRSG